MNLRTILILGALSAFGPLAIDFYLPAFPAMATAFGTDDDKYDSIRIHAEPVQRSA